MTSIEKLVYNLVYYDLVDNSPNSKFWEIVEEAKETRKEEIMTAYMKAKLEHIDTLGLNAAKNKIINAAEQYYQETFKKD